MTKINKFETGKLYVDLNSCGYGYDEVTWAEYLYVTRKTDKTIWFRRAIKYLSKYGTEYITKEEALTMPIDELVFDGEKRYKLKTDVYNGISNEYIMGADDTYINIKYLTEIKGDSEYAN